MPRPLNGRWSDVSSSSFQPEIIAIQICPGEDGFEDVFSCITYANCSSTNSVPSLLPHTLTFLPNQIGAMNQTLVKKFSRGVVPLRAPELGLRTSRRIGLKLSDHNNCFRNK